MSVTAQQVFVMAMAIADEMTSQINVVNPTDTDEYKARTPAILTMLQSELIKTGDLFSSFEFSNKPIDPLGGKFSGFDYVQYVGSEISKEFTGQAKAYYFETDGEGTVYIEDYTGAWNTLATVSCTDPTTRQFQAYKGVLTPTSGATKSRIRFTGSYEYTATNYALFGVPLKAARIPVYRPYFKVEMPSDFKSVDQIINEYPIRQYGKDAFYKWENRTEMWVNYYYEGNIRVNYRPVPAVISAMTDTLSIDDVTARSILVYGLAAELFKEENSTIYAHFMSKYNSLKALASVKQPVSEQAIIDIYGL